MGTLLFLGHPVHLLEFGETEKCHFRICLRIGNAASQPMLFKGGKNLPLEGDESFIIGVTGRWPGRTVLYPTTSLKSNRKINEYIDRITIKNFE